MKYFVLATVLLVLGMSVVSEAGRARRHLLDAIRTPDMRCDVHCGRRCSLECTRGMMNLCCKTNVGYDQCIPLSSGSVDRLFDHHHSLAHDDDSLLRLYRSVSPDAAHN